MSNGADTYAKMTLISIAVLAVAVAVGDLMYTKHPHVSYEAWFNFYGFFALGVTVLSLLLARTVRPLLGREEEDEDV